MTHLNESFLGVEEGITNAIKKLGIHAMGIDEASVRHEALDELAMALQCLKTGEQEVREVLSVTTSDAQAKTADSNARHGGAASNTSAPHGSISAPHGKDLGHPETAEKQPEPPSEGAETGKPYKVFQTLEELTQFVASMANTMNGIAHEEACRKGREDMRKFREQEALLEELMPCGHTAVDLDFLNEAHRSICFILERLPFIEMGLETEAEINAAALRVYSRLCLMLPAKKEEPEEDIDGAESAQSAENGSGRTEHADAEGGAS